MTRSLMVLLVWLSAATAAQGPAADRPPARADILRGEYGRYRANNDLLFYDLDVRVDPEKKSISGKNTIRFKMLEDDTRIQLDLYANLNVDKILFGTTPLEYTREINAVFVDFPETLKAGRTYSIEFHYSGVPRETGTVRRDGVSPKTAQASTGSPPRARDRAPASGGRTRISGATSRKGWS